MVLNSNSTTDAILCQCGEGDDEWIILMLSTTRASPPCVLATALSLAKQQSVKLPYFVGLGKSLAIDIA